MERGSPQVAMIIKSISKKGTTTRQVRNVFGRKEEGFASIVGSDVKSVGSGSADLEDTGYIGWCNYMPLGIGEKPLLENSSGPY